MIGHALLSIRDFSRTMDTWLNGISKRKYVDRYNFFFFIFIGTFRLEDGFKAGKCQLLWAFAQYHFAFAADSTNVGFA